MQAVVWVVLIATIGSIQQTEPTVSKDAVSVHRVERGTMALREAVTGSIASIAPARATVTLSQPQSEVVRPGQRCSIQILPPAVLGKVLRVVPGPGESATAEIGIVEPLPRRTSFGDRVSGLIGVGEAKGVLFFGRPADARPNSTAIAFLLGADDNHARRV